MSNPSDHDFEIRRQLVQMQMLYEVGLALSESLDDGHVAEQILHRALAMVDARAGTLLTRSAAGLTPVSEIGLAPVLGDLLEEVGAPAAWQQSDLCHTDRGSDQSPRYVTLVPLRFHEEAEGLLLVADKEQRGGDVGDFSEEDSALLEAFALQAGAALRNARLHRDLQSAFEALKAAQEKIAQLEQLRALGDLAGDLTHAMRHVMGLIVGHADSYVTLKSDPDQAMASILSAAEGGQELIGRIDRVTRLGVGADRSLEQLNDVVAEALADARQLAGADEAIHWQSHFAPDLPTSYMNRMDIKEAVVNLLVNAAQAIEDDGEVSLQTRIVEDCIQLVVADTGAGITPGNVQRIFDPFFTTKEGTGTGLGLSIVLRIAEDHQGEIDVDSVPGEGTRITLRLPVVQTAPSSPADGGLDPFGDDAGAGDATEDPRRR